MAQRGNTLEVIGRAIRHPGRRWRDADDPGLMQVQKRFHAAGDALLRVVYNAVQIPPRVVTVSFDRKGRPAR